MNYKIQYFLNFFICTLLVTKTEHPFLNTTRATSFFLNVYLTLTLYENEIACPIARLLTLFAQFPLVHILKIHVTSNLNCGNIMI